MVVAAAKSLSEVVVVVRFGDIVAGVAVIRVTIDLRILIIRPSVILVVGLAGGSPP